jgi:hypothetical protein
MKKVIIILFCYLMANYAKANCGTWRQVTTSNNNFGNVNADIYYKPAGAVSQRYHLLNTETKQHDFKCRVINLTDGGNIWRDLPISVAPILDRSKNESLINEFSFDSNSDAKVDKILYFGTKFENWTPHGGNGFTYGNAIHILEMVRVGMQMKAKFTKLNNSLSLPFSPNTLKGIINKDGFIYILGGVSGKDFYKIALSSLLSPLATWISLGSSLPSSANSELFIRQGQVCVLGNNHQIYKYNGNWLPVLTTGNNFSENTNYKVIKYRHLGDFVIYSETSDETLILDKYLQNITYWHQKYPERIIGKLFCADYTYYRCTDGGNISKYSLPKPAFNLVSNNSLIYEEDNFYLSDIGAANPLKLKGFNSGCNNPNYFIGVATANQGNVWTGNNPIPSLEKWITNPIDIQAINNGTFDLKAWMIANYNLDGDNNPLTDRFQTAGKVYKVSIAVGNPWTARPAIIKFL